MVKGLWLFLLAVLTAAQIWAGAHGLIERKRRFEANDDLGRLIRVSLKFFGDGRPPSTEEFWKAVGMAKPLLDPWGTPYRLESSESIAFLWRSAGPDRLYGTADDLQVRVPFGAEQIPGLPDPAFEDPTPPSRDVI